jgi:flagellin
MEISMERLASGKRINGAADDAAGIAIVSRMDSQIRAMEMSIKNVNDGISLAQTMEGALVEIEAMAQRIRELAVQASNETNDDNDQAYINEEVLELGVEIKRILTDTTFNGYTVYDTAGAGTVTNGQTAAAATTGFVIAVESGKGTTSDITVTHTSIAADTFKTAADAIDDPTAAATAIAAADTFIDKVGKARAELGAFINRFEYLTNSMSETIVNTEAAKGRILDTDFASETAQLSKMQILQQAGTAMLAQANAAPQSVLALLQ